MSQEAEEGLRRAAATHEAAASDVALLRKCLLLPDAAQSGDRPASPPAHGLEVAALERRLQWLLRNSSACESPLNDSLVEAGVYDCAALPTCKLACNGPSRPVLHALCQQCGCHTEWLLHSLLLHTLLAIFVFLCINGARFCAVEAIRRLLWRSLLAGSLLEFTANCDEDGRYSVPRPRLRTAIKEAVTAYQRFGWAYLAFALALQQPWIAALWYVHAHGDLTTV